jgi:protein-L-isoaspartate(D-aspartate) O-methyltransferase
MKARAPAEILGLLLLALLWSCRPDDVNSDAPPRGESWESLRERMVTSIAKGIDDERVLDAMRQIPRHRFVPRRVAHYAYDRTPLDIGEGQTISSPDIVARMTELLRLDGTEKVLEIGTGSGYQAAVLSRLAPKVYSIEIRPNLAESARERLGSLGYRNVVVRCGDGYKGWSEEAPFDAVIVTAAPPEIPEALTQQLARGGRMVVPVGEQDGFQQLWLLEKSEDGVLRKEMKDRVLFVPMVRDPN